MISKFSDFIFELYRTDRSNVFNGSNIKLISNMKDVISKYDTNNSYNFIKIEFLKKKNLDDLVIVNDPVNFTKDDISVNYNSYKIEFSLEQEDLSWGGIYPPILTNRYYLRLYPLADEYFLLSVHIDTYNFSFKDNKNKTSNSKKTNPSGSYGFILIDGDDHLEKAFDLIIKNYDKI